jgi:predicted HD phosphohydrolase
VASRGDLFLDLLSDLRSHRDSTPGREQVTGYVHSLQTATRARRDGADDELVAVALLHDVFHVLAPANHGLALATVLEDRLSDDRRVLLAQHSRWQHDVIHGTDTTSRFREAVWYADACRFGGWDAASFDPYYDSDQLNVLWPYAEDLLGG